MSAEVESASIWGNVDISDSDEEEVLDRKKKKRTHRESDSIDTEEGFPALLIPGAKKPSNSDDSSEDDGEEIPAPAKKNPYLAHMEDHSVPGIKEKLQKVTQRRNEARQLNHKEVAAEEQRRKEPKNQEARQKRAEWELNDKLARAKAKEDGVDYDRIKLLDEEAFDVELKNRRKKKKMNPDEGFSNYQEATVRQYNRLTKQMKPELENYQVAKSKMGDEPFAGPHNLGYGGDGKVSEAGIDRMCEDLEAQAEKRSKFHRRRQHYDEADIDYINERNKQFNEKAERFYGKYTNEIKQSLERGTAL